jgi:hypothetical protein
VSPYAYASNDPVNNTDPLGLFSFGSLVSAVTHVASHVVNAVSHVVHSATQVVTHTAQMVAGAAAHAFDAVNNALSKVAQLGLNAASHIAHAVMSTASRVVHVVHDAVSRTVGMVSSAASATWHWVQKHNQVFGKIGSVLANVSGGLALAGLIIAPIPGLDALTPVLEGAALLTSAGALAAQGIAKAAGDRDISYGDLAFDALGVIPGVGGLGRGAEEAAEVPRTLNLVDKAGPSAARDVASRGPILADTNVLVRAFGGHAGARELLSSGTTYMTEGVEKEFLNVAEAPTRQQFLTDMGIQRFESATVVGTKTYQSVFQEVLAAGHTAVDADLLGSAASSGYTAVSEERRLVNFVLFSRPANAIPIPVRRFIP